MNVLFRNGESDLLQFEFTSHEQQSLQQICDSTITIYTRAWHGYANSNTVPAAGDVVQQ